MQNWILSLYDDDECLNAHEHNYTDMLQEMRPNNGLFVQSSSRYYINILIYSDIYVFFNET